MNYKNLNILKFKELNEVSPKDYSFGALLYSFLRKPVLWEKPEEGCLSWILDISDEDFYSALERAIEEIKTENEEKKSEIIDTFNLQTEFIKNNISIPENITFLNTLKKKDLKELKNIYVEYLPLENKIKLKEKLDNGEPVYSDYSVVEII